MIATIATVCLAASAFPTPAPSQEGRQLYLYTQSLGERCDMVSYCVSGLTCTASLFGTGKCDKGADWNDLTQSEYTIALGGKRRKLTGYTQGLGESCEFNDSIAGFNCKAGLTCSLPTTDVFGTGKCVSKASNLRANNARKLSTQDEFDRKLATPDGRQLMGYTQSLGEHCDWVSFCKGNLMCNSDFFGTGKCIVADSLSLKILNMYKGR